MAVDISTLYFRWRCTYKLSHLQMDDVSDNVHFDLSHKMLYVDIMHTIYTLRAGIEADVVRLGGNVINVSSSLGMRHGSSWSVMTGWKLRKMLV